MNNTDVIRDLGKSVSTLEERLNNARAEISRVDLERSKMADLVIVIDKRLVLIEERLSELRKLSEEKDRRRWAVSLAIIGSLLSLAVSLALWFVKK